MPVVAIPAVAVACLALLALLVLWGAKAFGQALAAFIPKDLPLLGDRLHNIVLAFVAVAEAAVTWIMASFIRPAIGFVLGPIYRMIDFIDSVYALARTVATSWTWLLNSAIPAVISKLEGYAHALVVAARAYAAHLYHAAIAWTERRYHQLVSYAAHLYHVAVADAVNLYHRAVALAHVLVRAETAARAVAITATRSYALALATAARVDLGKAIHGVELEVKAITSTVIPDVAKAVAAGVTQAETYATTAVATGIGVLTTDVDQVVAAAFSGLITDVGELADVIGTDLPSIGDAVRAIPRAVPTDIAGAVGLSLALERVAVRYMRECGVPNCKNLGGIGRALSGLFGAIEGAAFLGLITYMVEDPQGAAHEAQSVLEPLASDLISGARDLIGV